MAAQRKKKVIQSSKATRRRAPVRRKEQPSENAFTHYTGFLFSRDNYIYMWIGIGLIVLGMFLMNGGHMPDDETWDPGIIYSFRRITLAPILILGGLGLQFYVIFKK